MKISRALRHNPLTSASVRLTFLPGLLPLTLNKRSIMLSISISPYLLSLLIILKKKLFNLLSRICYWTSPTYSHRNIYKSTKISSSNTIQPNIPCLEQTHCQKFQKFTIYFPNTLWMAL